MWWQTGVFKSDELYYIQGFSSMNPNLDTLVDVRIPRVNVLITKRINKGSYDSLRNIKEPRRKALALL